MQASVLGQASVASPEDDVPPASVHNNNNGVQLKVDHFKYLRALLPATPNFIESLSFNDTNNWECILSVALETDSECVKWLRNFSENTNSVWRVDHGASLSGQGPNGKVLKISGGSVYRCATNECMAKLEMMLLDVPESERTNGGVNEFKNSSKQFSALANINFYHNHPLQASSSASAVNSPADQNASVPLPTSMLDTFKETFKLSDSNSSHLKDSLIESLFLPSIPVSNSDQSVNNGSLINSNNAPSIPTSAMPNINLGAMQPIIPGQTGQVVILPENPQNRSFHNEVFSLEDVSRKLDEALNLLKVMLKKSGTSCAAVKQFTDHFDRLKVNDEALENALSTFGSDIQVPEVMRTPQQVIPPPTSSIVPQWSMTLAPDPVTNAAPPPPLPTATLPVTTAAPRPRKPKGPKRPRPNNSNKKRPPKITPTVLPGQIDPVTGKRRKRSRCGTCQGCINRDKTQDCRVCRNCLDQKRYGGPGRLKKACVNRSCVIMATTEGLVPAPSSAAAKKAKAASAARAAPPPPAAPPPAPQPMPITLPQHPLPVSESAKTTATSMPPSITIPPISAPPPTTTSMASNSTTAVLSWTADNTQYTSTFQVKLVF